MPDLWNGLKPNARAGLAQRDYSQPEAAMRLATTGIPAGELLMLRPTLGAAWIPGVELFPRNVHVQSHRGFFGELVRLDEGPLASIGLVPRQWASARMFAGTAKGFHIHPPYVPEGATPEVWLAELYAGAGKNPAERPYSNEQWDVMFFLQGNVDLLLVDERAGLPRRILRTQIDGDDQRGANNAGIIIPPGVAHALRVEGSRDLLMVYGTSTIFQPEFEGRIAAGIEAAPLPPDWQAWLASAQ